MNKDESQPMGWLSFVLIGMKKERNEPVTNCNQQELMSQKGLAFCDILQLLY